MPCGRNVEAGVPALCGHHLGRPPSEGARMSGAGACWPRGEGSIDYTDNKISRNSHGTKEWSFWTTQSLAITRPRDRGTGPPAAKHIQRTDRSDARFLRPKTTDRTPG